MISAGYLENVSYQQLQETFGEPRPTRSQRVGWVFVEDATGTKALLDLKASWCVFNRPTERVSWALAVPRSLARDRVAWAREALRTWLTKQLRGNAEGAEESASAMS